MRMKTCCQNIWKTLMINCFKNTVTVKILSFINKLDRATNEEDKKKQFKN